MAIPHGIRAVPTEGTRFRTTSSLLTKDNYTAWSGKMKALLLVNRVWDLVSGKRTRPNPAPAAIGAFGIDSNQDATMRQTKNWMISTMLTTKQHVFLLNLSPTRKFFQSPLSLKILPLFGTSFNKKSQDGPKWAKKSLKWPSYNSSMSRRKQQMKPSRGSRPLSRSVLNKVSLSMITYWNACFSLSQMIATPT